MKGLYAITVKVRKLYWKHSKFEKCKIEIEAEMSLFIFTKKIYVFF